MSQKLDTESCEQINTKGFFRNAMSIDYNESDFLPGEMPTWNSCNSDTSFELVYKCHVSYKAMNCVMEF